MAGVFHFLQAQPFIAIFLVVAAGMWLGAKSVAGISLGSVVCIIVAGLLVSIGSYNSTGVSLALPDILKTVFFNLFIFSMGVKIGPQFFAGLERDGWHMIAIGVIVAGLAPILAWACASLLDLPQGAVAGLLAGSNNSSASFGAASSAVQSGLVHPRGGVPIDVVAATLAAAFALCYTVSEVQYVLFMKWLPKLGGFDAPAEAKAFSASLSGGQTMPLPGTVEGAEWADASIAVRAYRVPDAIAAGLTIAGVKTKAPRIAIELVKRGGQWITPDDATLLHAGDEVVISGQVDAHVRVREALGPELPDADARTLMPVHTVDVVVGRKEVAGRSVRDLTGSLGPGFYPNAVFRAGEALPMGPETVLKGGDVIRVTGTEPHIAALGTRVGQVVRASHATDVLTLAIGLVLGAALGAIPVPLFGVRVSFGAAAVLVTGIVFGWLKTRHPALGGPLSEGGRQLMETMGLNVFTAVLALNSGQAVYEVIRTGPVWALVGSCLVVSGVPAIVAWLAGRHVLKLNPALLMGAIAGARQNTASLHAAQDATRSAVPGIGYPVPLAIATLALSVVSYFFAVFG
jgi:putative transport protein